MAVVLGNTQPEMKRRAEQAATSALCGIDVPVVSIL
jgi:hypothetical protein